MKYSTVGTSWITESFIEGASLVDGLSLDCVYSRSAEKGAAFAEKVGAQRFVTDFNNKFLTCDNDFIYVASPNFCHKSQSMALLSAGKNVICEKPITNSVKEFYEVCELADKLGLIYFEAIMYMHAPERQILKNAVARLGNVSSAHIDFSQLSSKYPALLRGETPNIFNPAMQTGALNDLGIYCVYPVIDLFGMPDGIRPTQKKLFTVADGCGSAEFIYPDKLVTVTYSKTGQSFAPSQIMGDKGTVTVESISKLTNMSFYTPDGEREILTEDIEKKVLMGNEARDAVRFIERDESYKALYKECRDMNAKVLSCMEAMRI